MKATLRRITMGILLLLSCSGGVRAQQATVKRNLVVRRDPSKSSPILDGVAKDDRLMLLQATADKGYYSVKTEHDVIGWVLANSVNVSLERTPVCLSLLARIAGSAEHLARRGSVAIVRR